MKGTGTRIGKATIRFLIGSLIVVAWVFVFLMLPQIIFGIPG